MQDESQPPTPAETRKLAAIMFTDIVGFSRQMGADEARMLRLLDVHNHVIHQATAAHNGHVINTVGDAFLVDFPSVVHAVQCAQHIQHQFKTHNAKKNAAEQIHIRVGIHLGDIVQRDGDVFGDGVNVAARLQALAEPDTICISQAVYKEVDKKLPLGTVLSLGRPKLKNIAERIQVYALLPEQPQGLRQQFHVQRLKLSRRLHPVHRMALAGLVVFLAGGIVTLFFPSLSPFRIPHSTLHIQEAQPPLPLPDKPSIVVLPFTNMSNDPEQEYFSDGITEDITSDLSKISSLFVISRNSAFTYKGKAVKLPEVSRELGVQYVLEGSVRKAGEQVRITAQLVDATQDQHVWSERYDRLLQDIFALQDEIREKIVFALKVKLTPEEQQRFRQAPTANLEAYDYYLRGLALWNQALVVGKKEANAQARQMYEKAIALDPQYAGAYASLAWTYWIESLQQWTPDFAQSVERAVEMAQRAVALDNSLPFAHTTLGQIYDWQKKFDQALIEAEQAVTLAANYADGYATLSDIQVHTGQSEKSLSNIQTAMRLNPHYPDIYLFSLGFAYRGMGQYEEALAPFKTFLSRNPDFAPGHVNLAICYAELGRLEEARAEVATAQKLIPSLSLETARQTWPYKNPADLERILAALRKAGLK